MMSVWFIFFIGYVFVVFFVKQKTAYEMRISDWSSDVCSSDLLGTMAGITRGSTRSDLESAYAAEVGETTLGTEFTAGGLSGLLDGTGPTAYITTLWAGTTCAFR